VKPQQKVDPKDRFETLTVQADGTVLHQTRALTLSQLTGELARFAAEPKPPVIQLRCDANAKMQHIITVMDELQKHNLTRISFPTQVEK
jgi:biopolymer transport protein ExbD